MVAAGIERRTAGADRRERGAMPMVHIGVGSNALTLGAATSSMKRLRSIWPMEIS
jgi:hypothetical protein